MACKAIAAIILFIVTYLALLLLAIGFTIICFICGVYLIATKPMLITIGLGVGLASLGFFILIFLFKFLFKKHKVDRSHLVEIFEHDEPKLFSFIREIVNKVQTDFPKRIYLSSDVNASVFYDSDFWSMIFPIRKNLQIGLGLVNTITEEEFKAILAHEFGHFSQRTMKVGSYVYNVNQVIFNMLYENESFDNMIQKWANISGYFSFFVSIAVWIIKRIQWVLRQMYNIVNIHHMALSREMEFHADEIAAHIAGYLPLKESLLRLNLADHCYDKVLNFYDNKIANNIKSKNIYKEQFFIMTFLANENNLKFKNNLPVVSETELKKYDKSKLTIKDQWNSHPSMDERLKAIEKINIKKKGSGDPANTLFAKIDKTQENVTDKLFSTLTYEDSPQLMDFETFKTEYLQNFRAGSFPVAYNSYYDNKNPIEFDVNNITDFNIAETMETLFSQEKIDQIYGYIALENDKNILKSIANKELDIKSFDYDGHKYKTNEALGLIPKLNEEQEELRKQIKDNDVRIYKFFYSEALKKNRAPMLKEKYITLFKTDSEYENKVNLYNKISKATEFISEVTPFAQIKENLKSVEALECELKAEIKKLTEDEILKAELSEQSKDNFKKYLSKDWDYFDGKAYYNDNLQILFNAIYDYNFLLLKKYFIVKSDLLNYQIELLDNNQ